MRFRRPGVLQATPLVLLLLALAGCSAGSLFGGEPEAGAAPAPAAEPKAPAASESPPVAVAGRWQLSAAAGGACFMNFAGTSAASAAASAGPQGTIAPEGGCPGNFFTSRKWTFEQGTLIIRDFKGRQLAQLSYLGGHFEGRDSSGAALTLSKQT